MSKRWEFNADGTGAIYSLDHAMPLEMEAVGTFGSGTVQLQQLGRDGTTWYDITGMSLTSNGTVGVLRIPYGTKVRAMLAGSTSPNLVVSLTEVI